MMFARSSFSLAAAAAVALGITAPAAAFADPAPPATPVAAPPAGIAGPQPGDAAPAFDLPTLGGKRVRLADYRGRTLVLNVWATWCPPCREEMPGLIASAPGLAKSGVAILGVDTTELPPIVRAYAAAKGVTYPLAIDADKAFETAYDIEAFPTTYVIDPNGIVRARYVDTLAPKQLALLVDAARAGRNAEILSPLQAKIDAMLTDPAIDFSASDPAALEAAAVKASAAIAKAEETIDDNDGAKGDWTNFGRTRAEEAALRDRAIATLAGIGSAVKDPALLPMLRADAARDRDDWPAALAAYRAVLALQPNDTDALGGVALASERLRTYDDAIAAESRIAELQPRSVTALVGLALTQNDAGHAADAYATFDRAVARATANAEASRGKPADVRSVAYAHLYAGRTYAKNGDAAHARAEFTAMLAWTQKLPADDVRHDMYLDEGQEAIAALGLTGRPNITVSLAPWIGADLPGSVPNTIKYRLVLSGPAGRTVELKAAGVPREWVASFCSDKLCAPMRVGLAIPPSGVKIVEFQLVPPTAHAAVPKVRVIGTDGTSETSATT
jgi:peroxiredoxin